ncbi:hypothetical protein QWY93_04570 [Echinicola jeungdonensis]|uniref:DUF748 domain-containing protein n=1 Tax=Echinicola jeungdonensis TaxID=709343 RepID=A0ABV5J1T0_9BACT|nr:hypothetical protein [Echinicola jeungdonensis]MDN3668597.1 hypothetical protein [Echinicola jeungdonensis]
MKKSHRRLIRVFVISIFSLLFLQVSLYFGSDWLLRSYLQKKVEEKSGGKYAIDFERFNISLLELGFYFDSFTLTPNDESVFEREEKPYYIINVPEVSLKGLRYDFSDKVIEIGTLRFQNPMIQSRHEEDILKSSGRTSLQLFEEEVRKSIQALEINEILLKDLFVDQADFLMENFVSERSIQAENANLHIQNLRLLQPREVPAPFNAQGFEMGIENFEMLLADSVHTIKAAKVKVSSLENFIRANSINLVPDLSQSAEVYYEILLDNLELEDADINKVFYTTEVDIGSLKINKPRFSLYSEGGQMDREIENYNLYPLIKDILASISIEDLEIKDGEYLQRSLSDPNKNRIEAARIQFEMNQVYLGPDEEKKNNQFFYAQDAVLDLSEVKVALADGVHWVTGEKVYLSSAEDRVKIDGIRLAPHEEVEEDVNQFEVEIPSLSLEKANLKRIYNESVLDISEMEISSPSVFLVNIGKGNEQKVNSTLKKLTQDYLRAIYIDRLELNNGDMVLSNKIQMSEDSLSFGKVSFVLENFSLDEELEPDSTNRIFLAEDLQLEIEDYALKLADNLHLFSADRIFVDTKSDFLQIDGFRFVPLEPDNLQQNLHRLEKTTALDIHIPAFYVHGIDIPTAYFKNKLRIKQIEIPSPEIKISRYIEKTGEKEKVERSDIYRLLNNYFSLIQVDSVSVMDGSIEYDNFVGDRIRTFSENEVSIHLRNFALGEGGIDQEENGLLFAEELDISLNNYVFNIAEGKYTIQADRVRFNSSQDELVTSNVRLRPRRDLGMKVALGADIPKLSFKGVDLEAFLFDNTLSLSKVRLSDAGVYLYVNRDQELAEEDSENEKKKDRNLPKTIDVIQIDTVQADNARFDLLFSKNNEERKLINTGVNLSFYGLFLDSAKLQEGDIVGFFTNMALDIDDFSLSLQDSIHTINFSKVELNTQSDEIILENFNVQPVNYYGKKGVPVIEARIPLVTLKTQSLTTFQETKDFNIQDLKLKNPEITLYLDQEKLAKVQNNENQQEAIQNVIQNLRVDKFHLDSGTIRLRKKGDGIAVQAFEDLNVELSDLEFDFTKPSTFDEKIFLNEGYQFELPDYELKLPDSLNILKVGLVVLTKGQMVLKDVFFEPRYGRYEYMKRLGHQADAIQAHIPLVKFEGLDVPQLLQNEDILAHKMDIQKPRVQVFRDKRYPLEKDLFRPMPQQLMRESGIKMEVDSLFLNDAQVIYEEFPEKGMVPGHITFDSLNARVSPFHLGKSLANDYQPDSSVLEAGALINGAGKIGVSVDMEFEAPYPMDVDVEIGEFDASIINTILATNAFARLKRGTIKPSFWSFRANDDFSEGHMTLRYNRLALSLLDERTLKKAGGRKGILNFVMNVFAVRGNNPRQFFNRLQSSPIYFERDKRKFIFNFWWKSTFSGIKGSLGLGEPGPARKEEE